MTRTLFLLPLIGFAAPEASRAAEPQPDPLPKGAKFRLGSDLYRHNLSPLWGNAALMPDGKGLLCTTRLEVIDFATGRATSWARPQLLLANGPLASSIAFSADGKRFVIGRLSKYHVFDVATNKELLAVDKPFDRNPGMLSADGSKLLVNPGGKVMFWDVASGKPGPEITYSPINFPGISLSPDGKTLAVSGQQKFDSVMKLWDVPSGKELVFSRAPSGLPSPAFSPDSKILALAGSDSVWLLDGRTGDGIRKIEVQKSSAQRPRFAQFTPDGNGLLVTSEGDNNVEWIEVATGKILSTTKCPVPFKVRLGGMVFTAPDRAVAWGEEWQAAYAWELPSGKPLTPMDGHRDLIRSVVFSSSGKEILTSAEDGRVLRWDSATGKYLGQVDLKPLPEDYAHRLTLSTDGRQGFSAFAAYDLNTGEILVKWPDVIKRAAAQFNMLFPAADAPRLGILGLSYSSATGRCIVCDAATGKVLMEVSVPADVAAGARAGAAMSPDGKRIVVSVCSKYAFGRPQSAEVRAWNVADGKKLFEATIDGSRGGDGAVAVSPDGKSVYVSTILGPVVAIEMETGKTQRTYGEQGKVRSTSHPVVSPNGKLLAISEGTPTGSDTEVYSVKVYEADTGKSLFTFDSNQKPVAFSPDGKTLATRATYSVLLWDLPGAK